ncbi:MgtC/SapB family protein [Ottowia caeni]|uniref:MgtC/SapB family protein n=1 Tax=Ottowia caeni TaxID=2870339 RepID=UPI001E4F5711|nr:MgtC/SapB family protein [Ottowia caeni]
MWQEVTTTLISEFADLPDAAETTRVLVRLLMAALFGGVLGYEREHRGKAAGLRTHMLVAMGAALFVMVPERAGMHISDMSRVIQGVVAGVGFLGAGAIIKRHSEEDVEGLTTAAGIWMTAAIGVTCGLGKGGTALLGTLFALLILALIPHISAPPKSNS